MSLALLAGALLLLPVLVTACGGRRETKTERQIKTYIDANQPYYEILKDAPPDKKVDKVICKRVTGTTSLACDITFRGSKTQRWAVSRETPSSYYIYRKYYRERRQKFYFYLCDPGYINRDRGYNPDTDPCVADISK